jgi:transcriptional adapter 2-alpha
MNNPNKLPTQGSNKRPPLQQVILDEERIARNAQRLNEYKKRQQAEREVEEQKFALKEP